MTTREGRGVGSRSLAALPFLPQGKRDDSAFLALRGLGRVFPLRRGLGRGFPFGAAGLWCVLNLRESCIIHTR
jgi:hypothetical protein